jgi:hypothetical protein
LFDVRVKIIAKLARMFIMARNKQTGNNTAKPFNKSVDVFTALPLTYEKLRQAEQECMKAIDDAFGRVTEENE